MSTDIIQINAKKPSPMLYVYIFMPKRDLYKAELLLLVEYFLCVCLSVFPEHF